MSTKNKADYFQGFLFLGKTMPIIYSVKYLFIHLGIDSASVMYPLYHFLRIDSATPQDTVSPISRIYPTKDKKPGTSKCNTEFQGPG